MVVLLFFVFFVVFTAEGPLVSLQRLFGRPGRPILSNSSEYLALVERADFAIYDHHDRYELGITFERQINCSLRDRSREVILRTLPPSFMAIFLFSS